MAAKKFPVEFKTCKVTDIKSWCLANDKKEWFKEQAKNKPHFFVLRNNFFKTFAPECMPVAKPKKAPWWEEEL